MLSAEGSGCTAKLADFGLAEMLVDGSSVRRSRAGTPSYLAPEIVEGKPYGTASDIWSLGCLLYVLLATELPRFGPGSTLLATSEGAPVDLKHVNASADCLDLLTKLLKRDPSDRLTIEAVLRHPFLQQKNDCWIEKYH